jgi:anti-sigma-K factor RskA
MHVETSVMDHTIPAQAQQPRRRWRRYAIAATAAFAVLAATLGLAASLNLTTDTLGAGQSVVAACQTGTLNVVYTPSYSTTSGKYVVGTVTVNGLQSGCYGKSFRVSLFGSGNTSLGEATGTTPTTGSSFTATFSPAVDAASVTGVALVIEG